MIPKIPKKLVLAILSVVIVITGTVFAIRWAQGYRPSRQGLQGTGLLAANSFPPAAQVYINGKLTTATDDTLNLPPDEYNIEIKKDGYITWKKFLSIQEELVTQTNATLFPSVPSLTPITFTGADNITPSPNGTKIAFLVTSASNAAQNGLYVYDLTDSPLSFRSGARQIAKNALGLNLEKAEFLWSPDSSQIFVHFNSGDNYLLEATRSNNLDSTPDVTARLPIIFSDWEKEITLNETQKILTLPNKLQQIATQSAKNIYFSPEEKKMLYTATEKATIPEELIPPLPASSTQEEQRTLEPGGIYIYDLKEDKNFLIDTESLPPAELGEPELSEKTTLISDIQPAGFLKIAQESSPSAHIRLQKDKTIPETIIAFKLQYSSLNLNGYQWFPTSSHLIINKPDGIEVVEYDSTNRATIYSGPREESFVYPWPNGSKLIILTNLGNNGDIPLNLYAITLK